MKCISIFKCNPQVEVIDVSHSHLDEVPNFQNYSRSLEELFIDANNLRLLNENVFKLTELRRLSISDNAISEIPSDISKLVNLVELDCSRNSIEYIPEQIKFLRGLQVCDFSANDIRELPLGLLQLKNLTYLSLNYCLIKKLPDDIGLLKNLSSLELRENEIEHLPSAIGGLKSLRRLDLGRNMLIELPDDIGRLTNLEYLLLDANQIKNVTPKIGRLENLQCLDLSKQEDIGLKTLFLLPEEIGGLISLTDLDLSENALHTLPAGLRHLKHLNLFKANNNNLSELNPSIGECVALQELVLTFNQITKLPPTIGALTELRTLNVDSNFLKELPIEIGHLKQLGILSLRDNLLSHLPSEVGQLEMLKVIDCCGNRLEYLPISLTSLKLKALWLSKNQAQPLPKLQIDELPNFGTRVLTCYLLPQQTETEGEAELDNNQPEPNYNADREAAVWFDPNAIVDDGDLENDANFVRHDTPHPRELRARHQKLFTNTTKGNENNEDYNHPPEQTKKLTGGVDNASFSLNDNGYEPRALNSGYIPQSYEYNSNGLPEISQTNSQPQLGNHHDYQGELQTEPANENQCYILDILVRRSKNHKPGLGLSIAGGKDTPPYKDDDEGIFVSKVTPGGPAEAADVRVGDKILAVNSHEFYEGITHHEAVDIFRGLKPDCSEFLLRILRDPNDELREQEPVEEEFYALETKVDNSRRQPEQQQPHITQPKVPISNNNLARTYTMPLKEDKSENGTHYPKKVPTKVKSASTLPAGLSLQNGLISKSIIYTTLVKDYGQDLGLILENRPECDDDGNQSNWSNIVIADIVGGSIADKDGKLAVGDRLLSVNGADVTGVDLERVTMQLDRTLDRFIRIVVSRGDEDDHIDKALKTFPIAKPNWFSSTHNMSHRPSLLDSYQRPTFGSVTNLPKQVPSQHELQPSNRSSLGLPVSKPPKPPKPSHLLPRESELLESGNSVQSIDDDPVARPRKKGAGSLASDEPQMSEAEKRAVWRRERLKSIEDDVEMAKLIAEAQRRHQIDKSDSQNVHLSRP